MESSLLTRNHRECHRRVGQPRRQGERPRQAAPPRLQGPGEPSRPRVIERTYVRSELLQGGVGAHRRREAYGHPRRGV